MSKRLKKLKKNVRNKVALYALFIIAIIPSGIYGISKNFAKVNETGESRTVLYLAIVLIVIVVGLLALNIKLMLHKKKEVLAFFEKHPLYSDDDYAAELIIDKNIEIMGDYLVNLSATPSITNIATSHGFDLKKIVWKFRTKRVEFTYFTEDGEEHLEILPPLSDEKIDMIDKILVEKSGIKKGTGL